jgi:pectinesterase
MRSTGHTTIALFLFLAAAADASQTAPPQGQPARPPAATDGPPRPHGANAIVALDGSGQYRTVQEAVNASPQNSTADNPWIVFIRAGTYRELVYVQREKRFLVLVGEDPATTVITYDLHANMIGTDGKPIGTFRTPTVIIDADDFTAENLTLENAAGPVGQALALRIDGDRVVFRNSRFVGWQDTIFLNRGRHYFEDSLIAGHVDFIFGGATSFFERCHIHAWRSGYITAAATPAEQPFGFVFANSRITGEPGARLYLGRPWRDYSAVTFLATVMSDAVRPEGWHNWNRPEREKTVRYSESGSAGPGADLAKRVPWAGAPAAPDAARLTPRTVLGGADGWHPLRLPAHPSGRKATSPPLPTAPGKEPR